MQSSDFQPVLSVIVVSYNTRHLLDEMMAALARATDDMPMQVVVVDNASRDGSAEHVRQHWPHVEVIANTGNVGFGRANNQALPLLRGRYILLLNTDAFVAPDSVRAALQELAVHPECGIVGMRLVGRDGVVQPSCRYFPTPWNILLVRTGFGRFFPRSQLIDDPQWDDRRPAECDWVPGAFLMCRREVIDKVGLFDPRYFLYYEEVDFCRAVKRAGWTVRYSPTTDVIHIGGESAKSEGTLSSGGRQLSALQVESELLYFRKQYGLMGAVAGIALTAVADSLQIAKRILRLKRVEGPFADTALSLRLFWQTRRGTRPTR